MGCGQLFRLRCAEASHKELWYRLHAMGGADNKTFGFVRQRSPLTAMKFEAVHRRIGLNIRRDELKAQLPAAINYTYTNGVLSCQYCGRTSQIKIGFFSHIRVHECRS